MEVYSIGFGGHSAPEFFRKLEAARIELLIDVRLNNVSQLAGFTKKSDLPFFLDRIGDIGYRHELDLAPTSEMLTAYRGKAIPWIEYEKRFVQLLVDRRVEDQFDASSFARRTALLCSEPTARHCHRRLVLEYLRKGSIPELEPVHL